MNPIVNMLGLKRFHSGRGNKYWLIVVTPMDWWQPRDLSTAYFSQVRMGAFLPAS